MTKVSVIIPTHNYGRYLGEALRSVLSQTFTDYEVLVIDDGSTDHTRTVIDDLRGSFGSKLHYWRVPRRGVYVARNFGIRHVSGKYIAFLDADDAWLPTLLEDLTNYLEHHPNDAMVYANTALFDAAMEKCLGLNFGRNSGKRPVTGRCTDQLLIHGNAITMMASMVRREVFHGVGLFDETCWVGGDHDFWMRLTAEHPIAYFDKVLCRVRRHDRNLTFLALPQARTQLKITRRIVRRSPQLVERIGPKQMQRKWREVYLRLAIALIYEGQRKRGRRFLREAFRTDQNFLKGKLWLYYGLSFFPWAERIGVLRQKWHIIREKLGIRQR